MIFEIRLLDHFGDSSLGAGADGPKFLPDYLPKNRASSGNGGIIDN
jgi:hypothetical protein